MEEQPDDAIEAPAEVPVDPAARRRRNRLLAIGLIALLIVGPLVLLTPYVHHRLTAQSPRPVASYEGFSLRQDPEFFELVMDLDEGDQPAAVFVQLDDQQKFALAELPEEVAAQLLAKLPERSPPTGANEYTDARSFLTYRDGRLVRANLHAQSKAFRVSGREAGPYFALPLDRKQLIDAFGEPERWERRATGPPEDDD